MSAAKEAYELHKAKVRAQTAERVERIAQMMADGRWMTRRSALELAKEWGLTYSGVRYYSALAAMRGSSGRTQEAIEEMREVAITRNEALGVKAEAAGDWRAAIEAQREVTKLSGVTHAPIQHQLILVDATGARTPQADNVLRAATRVGVDAAIDYLRRFPDDYEGARATGIEAAQRAALGLVIEGVASEVSQGELALNEIELPPEDEDDEEDDGWLDEKQQNGTSDHDAEE